MPYAAAVAGTASTMRCRSSGAISATRNLRKSPAHAAVACEIARIVACLAVKSIVSDEEEDDPDFCFAGCRGDLAGRQPTMRWPRASTCATSWAAVPISGVGGSKPDPARSLSLSQANYAPGTIVINTAERRLYLVLPNGQALRYGIGVGRDGFRWGGVHRITAKKEWPSWTPPSQMLAPAARSAAPHGRRHRQSARRARDVSRLDALSHPRLQRAGDDRPGGVLRLLPHDQRGRAPTSIAASRSAPRWS